MKDLTKQVSLWAYKIHPKIGQLYDWSPTYWNFAFVGALGMLINWLAFTASLGLGVTLAWFLGVLVSWNFNYILNKIWVFKEGKK